MSKHYDIEALDDIPIDEVLELMGARYVKDQKPSATKSVFRMHCFGNTHKNGDRNPSLAVWPEKNICKCYGCGIVSGGPVHVVTNEKGFKDGCEFLHDTFGVPYTSGEVNYSNYEYNVRVYKEEEVEQIEFNAKNIVSDVLVNIKDFIPKLNFMTLEQRLKVAYSLIYVNFLGKNLKEKNEWYKNRKIDPERAADIAAGHYTEFVEFINQMKSYFSIDDLNAFGLIDENQKWKYYSGSLMLLVPFQDISSDLITGFMLRITKPEKNQSKEYRITKSEIVLPIPYGFNKKIFLDIDIVVVVEGHPDGLSLKKEWNGKKIGFLSIPGIYGFSENMFGLLVGKSIVIGLDSDEPAKKAVYGYSAISFEIGGEKNTRIFIDDVNGLFEKKKLTTYLQCEEGIYFKESKKEGLLSKMFKYGIEATVLKLYNGMDINDMSKYGEIDNVMNQITEGKE